MTLLSPIELLALTPRRRIVGKRTRVVQGEVVEICMPQRRKQKHNAERRRESDRAYRERNKERVRAASNASQKRRYLRNAEAIRAYYRERMKGKQLKANYSPEQWQRRLDQHRASKERRDAMDPAYRTARLAKQLAYYYAKRAKA